MVTALTRVQVVDSAEYELEGLRGHVARLSLLAAHAGATELAGGVTQLQDAITRFESDVAAIRAARIQ